MKKQLAGIVILVSIATLHPNLSVAWHDATHMAVAKAAGIDNYYLAVGPDMAKEKAVEVEGLNHYYNASKGETITFAEVLDQAKRYNKPKDPFKPKEGNGHLYGAIIGAVNDYILAGSGGKYANYPLGYAMHYIGDLSMPFHNIEYDEDNPNHFNVKNHPFNDGIVERTGPPGEESEIKVARLTKEIRKRMDELPPLELPRDINLFYKELAANIAEIGSSSAEIGYAMKDAQKTVMSEDEVYKRLALSARLLKAVHAATKR